MPHDQQDSLFDINNIYFFLKRRIFYIIIICKQKTFSRDALFYTMSLLIIWHHTPRLSHAASSPRQPAIALEESLFYSKVSSSRRVVEGVHLQKQQLSPEPAGRCFSLIRKMITNKLLRFKKNKHVL